ncbi:MAG: DUF1801 domain-containing protein [Saprospiraceae bacterium]|nr:DUF1801 domain-containing protein [Saprospiraceae bacterium]
MEKIKAKTIDEYILNAPLHAQAKLIQIRKILKEIAPNAKEAIKWGQPVLEGKKILYSFSAYKSHLNFMPTGPSLDPFREELKDYKMGKDTVQFPYDQELPIDLIRRMAQHRLKEVEENNALWMY